MNRLQAIKPFAWGRAALLLAIPLLLCASASSAYAAPATPRLTVTNPVSPGASISPLIRGEPDGVSASAVHTRAVGPIANALEPGNTITIYTDENCLGSVAATGTAAQLEGAGIQVTVSPDSETTFYATQSDLIGPSGCSNGIVYQQVTTPPAPPVFSAVNPASPANDNFPHLVGNSAANSIVFLYADSTCSGAVVASGPAAAFAAGGIQVQVADNSVTTFHAIATLAGISSGCSSSAISYQEVTPPAPPTPPSDGPAKPQPPRLRTIPGGIANSVTPMITGNAPGAVAVKVFGSANCKGPVLTKGSAAQFAAGLLVQILPNTTVAFYGKSVDGDGDESACSPAPAIYTDDSIAPRTRFTAGPSAKTFKRTVVFRFADITGGFDTNFLCKVDRWPWKNCHTPLRLKRLGHRRHVLRVKAFDAAGNYEKRGVKRRFQVVRAR